ncbi:Rap1a/Tai family immunity protein [Acidiphilium sp.]|jgi:hypothetical protein|uniref:Rap1a/Tai family immunity protein n=1 Tax=Acidiphilium sp. TaxID=527 RepID=UPI00258A7CE4|nr:Rap1a/Tai family immunity protein [Acidiphilium sp.]
MRLAVLGCLGLLAATPALAQSSANGATAPSGQAMTANTVMPVAAQPMPTASPLDIHNLRDLALACTLRNDNPYYVAGTSLCAGYEAAVLDFHLLDTMGSRHNKRKVCLPNPAPTRRQSVAGLVSWVQSNPQYLDEPAASGVLRYFINTYPCHRKTFQWSPPGPMQ